MSMPWFKFYGVDFRDGVRGVLSLEETGAYVLLLTLLYDGGGKVLDDDAVTAARLHCDIRVWKRVKEKLCRYGKIVPTQDGFLINHRVMKEITSAELVAEKRRTSGKLGGQQSGKVRAKPLNENETGEAIASNLLPYARALPEPEPERDSPSLRSGEVVALKRARKPTPQKGSRFPDHLQTLPDDWRDAALTIGLTHQEAEYEFQRCRDWARSAAGAKGVKLDWLATFRNWCRSYLDRRPTRSGSPARAQRKSGATLILEDAGLFPYED